jgi:hypothetical protein
MIRTLHIIETSQGIQTTKETLMKIKLKKVEKLELLDTHFAIIAPLKFQAGKAFGSRDTASANHTISREYTIALKDYADMGGSLLLLAEALEVTYPALRRRVMTAVIPALPGRGRSKASAAQYALATKTLTKLRKTKKTTQYHDAIKKFYDEGLSVTRMARELGLKSAYPLYYGLNKARLREKGESN